MSSSSSSSSSSSTNFVGGGGGGGGAAVSVVVVGSCNTDLTAYVPRLPAPGETIHGDKFQVGFGGKGANQCVMAAKMGARTAMVGKVGTDSFGSDTFKNFKDVGVDVTHLLTTDAAATGVAPIAVDASGQNSIIVVNGANDLLTVEEVEAASDMLSNAKVIITQLEIKREVTLRAMQIGKAAGVTTIFNPAPAQADLASEFFTVPDIICLNETETELVIGGTVDVSQLTSQFISSSSSFFFFLFLPFLLPVFCFPPWYVLVAMPALTSTATFFCL